MAESSSGIPVPKSLEQIQSDMLSSYASKMGISDFNTGSAVNTFFEVVALAIARSSGDLLQVLKDFSIERASGETLKRLARENNVTPLSAKPSSGLVTVTDTSFNKIATKVYAGANPPNIGSTQIKVSDASAFTGTGSIYIGRGTTNVEGPIAYTSITPFGGYYIINLSSATTKFHNVGETVILAQGGNRSVPINSIVSAPSSGASPDIQFSISSTAIILDGETEVSNVQVSALITGSSGNVPRGAIKQFITPPFSGASVTNPLPFTTGVDSETDDQLRTRIKQALSSIGLGTPTAIKAKVQNATSSDEPQSSVVSSSITTSSIGATLYIDDGTGYEAKTTGVGLESIIDSALGGEQFFQLSTGGRQAPIAKAFLETSVNAPFDLIGGDTLAVIVGEVTYQHVFATTDFKSPGGATAFEVVASINSNTTLGFEASTSNGGQKVVIRAKSESNDSIKATTPTTNGRDASIQLSFPANEIQTLRLYKNKLPLSKDGSSASIFTQSQQLWSASIATGDTLILSVDGTSAITYTITDADFIATGLYTTVSSTNSLESWVEVFNNKLTGVTVSIVGQQLEITSNLGASDRASVSISPSSTLVTNGMFSSLIGLSATGKTSDYILDRNTAQFKLVNPLTAGDNLSSGSEQTEAIVQSNEIPGGSITFASDAHIWILLDNSGTIIPTGVAGNTTLGVSKPAANTVRYTSSTANSFQNVQVGDYVIIWSEELVSANRLEGRVNAVTSTTLDMVVTASEYAAASVTAGVIFSDGFTVLRSTLAPQKFKVASGTKTLDQISQELQLQTDSAIFSVQQDQFLVIRSSTRNTSGKILIVTSDANGKLLNIPNASTDTSKDSLIAFYDSQGVDANLPLFIHSSFASDSVADPIDSYVTSLTSSISLAGRDHNEIISFLHPYGPSRDAQMYKEYVQEKTLSGAVLGVENNNLVRRVRTIDRYFLANPLDFGSSDSAISAIDNDTSSKSFEIPLYRRALTNTGLINNANNFNAYDVDSGPTANFSSAFGSSFDFSNFKVLMQAKKVLKHTNSKTALLYRSTKWGRSGEKINVGYIYPSSANSSISSTTTVSSVVDVRINLQSGPLVASSIDASTEWNISVTPNTPSAGIDQVTYTWSGTGTAPGLGSLVGGEYVNITSNTEFNSSNVGIFRISTEAGYLPTATSFTIQRGNGAATSENNKATLVSGAITFYQSLTTTAADIDAYVNANLTDYFTTTIVNDGGTDGSGVIDLSTFEDSGFTYESVYLLDGINWLYSSNLGGSPNFTFKTPLSLPSDVGYAFNDSEEVRLIPTTMDQVSRFISVLAVTGFSTVGTIRLADRATTLELATNTLGSDGAIQIIGGLANQYSVPVLESAIRINNTLMSVSTNSVSSQGMHSDQWFRLQASYSQKKEALMSSNTSITVLGDNPTTGQSTIRLSGRNLSQRYFGKPRNHVRSRSRNFRIEKQGALACLSWDNQGSNPFFEKTSLNFDDSAGGTLNVSKVGTSNEADYIILTGNANFTELSIGDLLTVGGLPIAANNGTFLVTGVSSDGTTVRVLNPDAQNEYSFGTYIFTGNSTAGDTFTVNGVPLVAGTDFAIGGTQQDTATNLSAVIGTVAGVSSTVNGSVVTITADSASATIAISYSGTAVVTVSGPFLVGESFSAGDFAAYSGISEGDTMVVDSPFNVLNRGNFRIIRRYNNSVWFENPNMIEEEVTLPYNSISVGHDSTTSFKVNATNNSIYLNWNGVGTEPNLENIRVGDIVTFGIDFATANRGDFMALRSGNKLQQIFELTIPASSQFTASGPGKYFTMYSANNVVQYYIWFNLDGTNSDPAPGGTGIMVSILSGNSSATNANNVKNAINSGSLLTATSSDSVVTVTSNDYIETNDPTNFNVPSPFTINILQDGRRTFVECINPSATNEAAVLVTAGVFQIHRPQIQFYEYEATVPGDILVVTGDTLGLSNAGSHTVVRVVDVDTVTVTDTLSDVSNSSLNGRETSVYVEEGVPYTGYKKVSFSVHQPGTSDRNLIVLDTNNQYSKINEAAGIELTSLSKLNFSTSLKNGLDSYRYNTGLIAECNRIVYGDPTDPYTYPGVGAAGADVFIREPLIRRIQASIDIRVNTGVPFTQTSEQVRNSVASLVNSNPIGESIAISDIVSVVNSIPGVRAVAISSPQYDVNNDLIFLAPGEKAKILDPLLDVSVSLIG